MDTTAYGIGIDTSMAMDDAEQAIRAALAAEGFGILTEIDVAATMKAKLGVEGTPYKILGACNPPLAHAALGIDEHIGLLLPCNVIVYEVPHGVRIEAMDPGIMSQMVDDPAMVDVAAQARQRLVRALAAVEVSS
jgi:uncharacterized protein (DUF302 family)